MRRFTACPTSVKVPQRLHFPMRYRKDMNNLEKINARAKKINKILTWLWTLKIVMFSFTTANQLMTSAGEPGYFFLGDDLPSDIPGKNSTLLLCLLFTCKKYHRVV